MYLRFATLVLPSVALLLAAGFLLPVTASLTPEYQHILTLTPYLLAFVAGMLGYVFKRSRILFAALNLSCAYALIQTGLQTSLNQPDAFVLFSCLSILLPFHLGLIALYKERGLLTPLGIIRLVFILVSYLPLYLLWSNGQLGFYLTDLPMSMLEMLSHEYYLIEAAAIAYGLALIPVIGSFVLRKTYTDAALLAALISSAIMLSGFDKPMISALFISASLISLATSIVQNSYQMAFIDELTAIPGRRALQDKLATLGKRYSLAMCDIDHFKKFNDTYGHDVGDQVLKMVAAKLNQVKGGGRAYRYGGEEFTLVFAGKDESQALPYIEELRETIANYPMHIRNQNRPKDNERGEKMRKAEEQTEIVKVTISIGVCEKKPEFNEPQDVIKKSDEALYAAKNNGRNCVVAAHFTPEKPKSRRKQRHDYA